MALEVVGVATALVGAAAVSFWLTISATWVPETGTLAFSTAGATVEQALKNRARMVRPAKMIFCIVSS